MASPSVIATNESAVTAVGTTHAVNLPAFPGGAAACIGQLLLIMVNIGSTAATFNALGGYTELLDEGVANGMAIWTRTVDGSEGATVSFTSSASTKSAHITYLIDGWSGTPTLSTVATGTSTGPDATSVSAPASGNSERLYVSVFGCAGEEADDDTWCNNAPTGYSGLLQKTSGTAGTNIGAIIAAAWRQIGAGAEDPGAFNQDGTLAWRAYTIAVSGPVVETAVNPPPVDFRMFGPGGLRKGVRYNEQPTAVAGAYSLSVDPGSYAVTGSDAGTLAGHTVDASSGSYAVTGVTAGTLAGYAINAAPGTYAVTGITAGLLAGYAFNAAPGTYAITGISAGALAGFSINAAPGTYAVNGATAALESGGGLDAQPGTYAVTGTAAALLTGYSLSADPGAYAVSGSDAGLVFTGIPVATPVQRPETFRMFGPAGLRKGVRYNEQPTIVGAYSLTADPGTYTVTGSAATLTTAPYQLSVDPGVYALTGFDSTVVAGRNLSADPGTYAVAGQAATVVAGYVLSANPGSYAVAGLDAAFVAPEVPPTAVPDVRQFHVFGPGIFGKAGLRAAADTFIPPPGANFEVNAAPGSYSVSGIDATLQLVGVYALDAQPGVYAVTGLAAAVVSGRVLDGTPGAYAITGVSASAVAGYVINAAPGVYVVTGSVAELLFTQPGAFVLLADPGAYLLTGTAATVAAGHFLSLVPGVYTVTGIATGHVVTRALLANPGTYVLNGVLADLDHGGLFVMLEPIYTGAIAGTLVGAADGRENGHVADTVAGVVAEEVTE